MAKSEASRVKKDNFLISYFKETRAELRKVHWPSREETRMLTLVVLAATVGLAFLLGVLDFVFDQLLNGIINLNPLAIGFSVLIVVGMFVLGYLITRGER
jgi:preprotein translocase subunit SecE